MKFNLDFLSFLKKNKKE